MNRTLLTVALVAMTLGGGGCKKLQVRLKEKNPIQIGKVQFTKGASKRKGSIKVPIIIDNKINRRYKVKNVQIIAKNGKGKKICSGGHSSNNVVGWKDNDKLSATAKGCDFGGVKTVKLTAKVKVRSTWGNTFEISKTRGNVKIDFTPGKSKTAKAKSKGKKKKGGKKGKGKKR